MSISSGKPGDGLPFEVDALKGLEQPPIFAFEEDYSPLFPMSDTEPLVSLDALDPEETFDALFGDPSAPPAGELERIEDGPNLDTMRVAKVPGPKAPPLPLPPIS